MKKILPILALFLASCGPDPAIPLPSKGDKYSGIMIGGHLAAFGVVDKVEGTAVTLTGYEGTITIDWMKVTSVVLEGDLVQDRHKR